MKERASMSQTNTILDPMQTGSEAKSLGRDLRALVVGQDEAIEQIINVYQMYLTGLIPAGRPIGNFLFLGPRIGKNTNCRGDAESLENPGRLVTRDSIRCGA